MTKAAEENASLRQKMLETMQRSAATAAAAPALQPTPLPGVLGQPMASPAPTTAPERAKGQRRAAPIVAKKATGSASTERIKRPSIRLTDEDLSRVRDVMSHALSIRENISTTDVLRLALHEWDFRKLTPEKISELRAQDGRRKSA